MLNEKFSCASYKYWENKGKTLRENKNVMGKKIREKMYEWYGIIRIRSYIAWRIKNKVEYWISVLTGIKCLRPCKQANQEYEGMKCFRTKLQKYVCNSTENIWNKMKMPKEKLKVKKKKNRMKRRQHWYSIVLQWFLQKREKKKHTFLYLLVFFSSSWLNWIKPSANMLRWAWWICEHCT